MRGAVVPRGTLGQTAFRDARRPGAIPRTAPSGSAPRLWAIPVCLETRGDGPADRCELLDTRATQVTLPTCARWVMGNKAPRATTAPGTRATLCSGSCMPTRNSPATNGWRSSRTNGRCFGRDALMFRSSWISRLHSPKTSRRRTSALWSLSATPRRPARSGSSSTAVPCPTHSARCSRRSNTSSAAPTCGTGRRRRWNAG